MNKTAIFIASGSGMGADVQNNLLYIKGAVPGFVGSIVKITPAVKQR